MKIMSVVGARPAYIKACKLSQEIRKNNQEILVDTGQHYDENLNKIFFDELEMPIPKYNLGVGSASRVEQIAEIMKRLESVIDDEKPDLMIVYGDTNSTLGGALCGVSKDLTICHIEAGLRSYDKNMPEETNRVIVDHISDILFAPTKNAVENLKREGIIKNVFLTGDLQLELLESKIQKIKERKDLLLERYGIEEREYCVATIHRKENTDEEMNLKNILEALQKSKEKIVIPLHPRTRKKLKHIGVDVDNYSKNMKFIQPLGYMDFMSLVMHSKKIITDSGGLQKEAYHLGVPCITVRENTEWIETVQQGWNILVRTEQKKIIEAIERFEPDGDKDEIYYGKNTAKDILTKIEKIIGK
jgi:UDP-N-acetylglucosamine 2-epimerase